MELISEKKIVYEVEKVPEQSFLDYAIYDACFARIGTSVK
jgi:hypothetical protein